MKLPAHIKFHQIAILLTLACIIGGCNGKDDSKKPTPPSVVVAKAFKQSVIESMSVVGQVTAKESVYLRARVKGFLEKRDFIEGSFVRKNDLLFQIEKMEYEANVEAAKAQLDMAKANLKNDTIDYERQKYLSDKDAVSLRIYEKAVAQKAISEASVLSAKAALKEAKLKLSYTDINAPFNGRIGIAKYSVGNVVGPNSEPLGYVVMVDPIQIEFNLTESFITTILQEKFHTKDLPNQKSRKGPSAEKVIPRLVLSNGTKYPEAGEIDFIDNVVNPMTGTIKLRALFKNPKAILIPGAYVTVSLQDQNKKEALLIPQAAIQEDQTGKFVMQVSKDNEVKKQNITTGSIYGVNIVVKSGLQVGDLIIEEGLQKVRSGVKVNPAMNKEKQQKTKEVSTNRVIKKESSAKTLPVTTENREEQTKQK